MRLGTAAAKGDGVQLALAGELSNSSAGCARPSSHLVGSSEPRKTSVSSLFALIWFHMALPTRFELVLQP
jgi:hypothetical protein